MNTTHYGCYRCGLHFPCLELALQHLRKSSLHQIDTLELMEKFDSGYRMAVARMMLFSFTINSESQHDAALKHAEGKSPTDVQSAMHHKRATCANSDDEAVAAKRGCPGSSVVDNSTRTQSIADSSNVTTTVFAAPITVRVTLCSHTPPQRDVFTFPFARDQHTTVQKLLEAVATTYRQKRGADVDLDQRRLLMYLSKKGVPAVGGGVGSDADMEGLSKVQGVGWFGVLIID